MSWLTRPDQIALLRDKPVRNHQIAAVMTAAATTPPTAGGCCQRTAAPPHAITVSVVRANHPYDTFSKPMAWTVPAGLSPRDGSLSRATLQCVYLLECRVRRTVGGVAAGQNAMEARNFGISTDRACLEIEHVLYDAAVLRHTITVDFSGQPCVIRHVPTPEELARPEEPALPPALPADRRIEPARTVGAGRALSCTGSPCGHPAPSSGAGFCTWLRAVIRARLVSSRCCRMPWRS